MARRNIHERTLDNLEGLLDLTGDFVQLRKHVRYGEPHGLCGELDLEGDHRDGTKYYFEVKSSLHPRNVKKAEHQAYRCKKARPTPEWTFLLITPVKGQPENLFAEEITPTCHHLSGYLREYDWLGNRYGTCNTCHSDVYIAKS